MKEVQNDQVARRRDRSGVEGQCGNQLHKKRLGDSVAERKELLRRRHVARRQDVARRRKMERWLNNRKD